MFIGWVGSTNNQAREIQYFGTPNTHHFTWVDIESKKWPWPKEHIGSCTYPWIPPSSLTQGNAVCTLRRGRTFVWTTSCQLRLPGSEEQIGTVRLVSRFCHYLGIFGACCGFGWVNSGRYDNLTLAMSESRQQHDSNTLAQKVIVGLSILAPMSSAKTGKGFRGSTSYYCYSHVPRMGWTKVPRLILLTQRPLWE